MGTGIEACWARVQRALGKSVSRNWLGKAEIAGPDEDGELTITLPTQFNRDHVAKHYGDRLAALWRAENPEVRRVNLVAAPEPRAAAGD